MRVKSRVKSELRICSIRFGMWSLRCVLPFKAGIYCGKDISKWKIKSRERKIHAHTENRIHWRSKAQSKRRNRERQEGRKIKNQWRSQNWKRTTVHVKRIFASDIFRSAYDYSSPSNNSGTFQMFRCIILHFVHYKQKLSHLNMLDDCIVRSVYHSLGKISLSAFGGQTTFIYHFQRVQKLWIMCSLSGFALKHNSKFRISSAGACKTL